jgi:hypothetical protein
MQNDSLAQRHLISREALLSYRPDKDDRSSAVGFAWACGLGLMGVLWLAAALLMYGARGELMFAIIGMMGIVPLFYGSCALDQAIGRRHGNMVAKFFSKQVSDYLPKQWDVVPDGFLHSADDVDLVLRLHTNELCVVLIKPWAAFSVGWRARLALKEAQRRRQRAAASYAVVWLPNARPTARIWHGGGVAVGGGAMQLFETIREIADQPETDGTDLKKQRMAEGRMNVVDARESATCWVE